MLNVAIIGAGLMGRWHFEIARSLGARVVAIVDSDPSAARRLAQRRPNLLERGISALVEKPLAVDAATTRRMLEAASRTGTQICPVHQYAFQRGVERARTVLPRLGTVHRVEFNICSAGAADGVMAPDDLIDEILPHPISILQRLFPDMPINRLERRILRAGPGELLASSKHGETLISIYISANARPTRMTTQLQCANGSIEIDGYHGYAIVLPGVVSRTAKIGAPFTRSWRNLTAASSNLAVRALDGEAAYPGLRELTRQFYAAVERNDRSLAPVPTDAILAGAEARDVLRLENAPAVTAP